MGAVYGESVLTVGSGFASDRHPDLWQALSTPSDWRAAEASEGLSGSSGRILAQIGTQGLIKVGPEQRAGPENLRPK
ncbi:MAG: hypothetical protein COA78_00770 [Blastopirellula sp.]|nr:MAG: hypothetical protein COA78_00770 [Blastopirellula sp.]